MQAQKEQVQIAAKMYRCQESAKKLFREEYDSKVQRYIDFLHAVMMKEKVETLPAVILVSDMEGVKDNGMAMVLFMAAAVEIVDNKK